MIDLNSQTCDPSYCKELMSTMLLMSTTALTVLTLSMLIIRVGKVRPGPVLVLRPISLIIQTYRPGLHIISPRT